MGSTPHQSPSGDDRVAVENLQRTINERLVTIAFQPIVSLESPGVLAYEALTRPMAGSGFETPDQLFDSAEAMGMIWDLERVTRRAALEAAADWAAGPVLFVNATPRVIADDRFAETMMQDIADVGGLCPKRIVLEVTERSENDHMEGLQRQTAALQKHGIKIAIDDVGAGTSGLNRIMILRPQWLKLDRVLIKDVDRDPVRTNLLRFLTHFGRLSGVSIIGEGVERAEELQRLMSLGVTAAQGFIFGKPGDATKEFDDGVIKRIQAERAGELGSVFYRDRMDTISDLIQPSVVARASDPASSHAAVLEDDPALLGVVVDTGSATPGWCPRDVVLSAQGTGDAELGELASPFAMAVGFSEKIEVVLQMVASLESAGLEAPIALTSPSGPVGMTRLRDLLRAASAICHSVRRRSATLTGLPGRVRCEEELHRALREEGDRDVAFIDIRNISEYNTVFGFELGDQLITNLVEVISAAVREADGCDNGEAFLGHLGDDRLMLITPEGVAKRIALPVVEAFESRVIASGISPQVALAGIGKAPALPGLAIRYLVLPSINTCFASPQELMQTEPILRAMADEQAAIDPTRTGYVIEAPTDITTETFLLAA